MIMMTEERAEWLTHKGPTHRLQRLRQRPMDPTSGGLCERGARARSGQVHRRMLGTPDTGKSAGRQGSQEREWSVGGERVPGRQYGEREGAVWRERRTGEF